MLKVSFLHDLPVGQFDEAVEVSCIFSGQVRRQCCKLEIEH